MTKSTRSLTPFSLSVLALAFVPSASAHSQVVPDAGQIMRELRQLAPGAPPASQGTPAPGTVEQPAASAESDVRITVTGFDITGNTAISTEDLQELLDDQLGRRMSLADLKNAAARLTALYRDRGFPVARAYLPAQDVEGGKVNIVILEGNFAQLQLRNASTLSDERALALLDQAVAGSTIRSDHIDRGLLLLNDVPGVGAVRATLQPGAAVGTSDLLVEVDAGPRAGGNLALDNYGSRYTGHARMSGSVFLNNALGIGDQAILGGLLSDRKLGYFRAGYSIPLGGSGLRIGGFFSATRYDLAREFAALDAHGTARSLSVYATYPFIRSQRANLAGSASVEKRRLSDRIGATETVLDKNANVLNLGLNGSYRDTLGGGGLSSLDISAGFGKLDIQSPDALAIDESSARTSGSYRKLYVAGNRLQRIGDNDSIWLAWAGQWASKNLDSSEKFVLGGANGVRAYPQGEGIGDEGYLASLEYRHNFGAAMQGTVFYDAGSVTINRKVFDNTASNKRNLAGAGLGLNAVLAGTDLKASLAWRTNGGEPLSVPPGSSKSPTLWVRASRQF